MRRDDSMWEIKDSMLMNYTKIFLVEEFMGEAKLRKKHVVWSSTVNKFSKSEMFIQDSVRLTDKIKVV